MSDETPRSGSPTAADSSSERDHAATTAHTNEKGSTSLRSTADHHAKGNIGARAARFFDWPVMTVGNGQYLSGKALNWSIAAISSCGFLMFGYDQGVLSALLTLDDFQRSIPLMTPRDKANPICWLDDAATIPNPDQCHGSPNTQAAGVAIYQIGCFMGALLVLFFGESWGRKPSTQFGSIAMIIGTIMQAASFEYGLFVAGRIVGGIGNGIVTSSTFPAFLPF